MNTRFFCVLTSLILLGSSCKKDEVPAPSIIGIWTLDTFGVSDCLNTSLNTPTVCVSPCERKLTIRDDGLYSISGKTANGSTVSESGNYTVNMDSITFGANSITYKYILTNLELTLKIDIANPSNPDEAGCHYFYAYKK